MDKIILKLNGENTIEVKKGTILADIVKQNYKNHKLPVVLAKVNGKYKELTETINENGDFEIIDISTNIGMRTYIRTLQFVLIKQY